MGSGLIVRNPTVGVVQIDGEHANLALKTKQTYLSTTFAGVTDVTGVQFSISGVEFPAVALRCDVPCGLVSAYETSGVFHYLFWVQGPSGTPVTAYIFDDPALPTPTAGLVLRNEITGKIVFNHKERYMKVIDSVIAADGREHLGDRLYQAGRQYACLQNRPSWNSVNSIVPRPPSSGGAAEWCLTSNSYALVSAGQVLATQSIAGGVRLSQIYRATGQSVSCTEAYYIGWQSQSFSDWRTSILVLDVTGY